MSLSSFLLKRISLLTPITSSVHFHYTIHNEFSIDSLKKYLNRQSRLQKKYNFLPIHNGKRAANWIALLENQTKQFFDGKYDSIEFDLLNLRDALRDVEK